RRPATGAADTKTSAVYALVGRSAQRVDLAAKVFGQAVFIHDMMIEGMLHARVVRQPTAAARLVSVDEAAIRKGAMGPIEIVRLGSFVAIVGSDETTVEAAAQRADSHVAWDGADPLSPMQEEARWLLQRPSVDRLIGPPAPSSPGPGAARLEA